MDAARPPMFASLLASRPEKSHDNRRATAVSVVIHAAIIAVLIYMPVHAVNAAVNNAPVLIALPQEQPPLPPPPVLERPHDAAAPTPTIRGFADLPVPDIVPTDIPLPQPGVHITEDHYNPIGARGGSPDGTSNGKPDDATAAPFMTPTDVGPKLLNRTEITDAISRTYPAFLRDAGIGGTTTVWFHIDEHGKSIEQLVKTTSGYAAFDSAAMRIAPMMRFTPGQAHEKAIPVWVTFDIVFKVR